MRRFLKGLLVTALVTLMAANVLVMVLRPDSVVTSLVLIGALGWVLVEVFLS